MAHVTAPSPHSHCLTPHPRASFPPPSYNDFGLLNVLCNATRPSQLSQTVFSVCSAHLCQCQPLSPTPFKTFASHAHPCSYGDFGLLHILYNSTTVEPTCLDGHPVIGAWFARMKGLPSMQKYLAERPKEVGRPGSLITTLQL